MSTFLKHEEKICQRCGAMFECKVGDIANCQCQGIKFEAGAIDFIAKNFDDCLCRGCLIILKVKGEKVNGER